ncbi:hypothetical protein CLH62_19305 [Marinobacter guineae]|uniref:Uncharacterized protein n=1 Tax=Marinobacter guineae TaxID=432303 RepID=A0A2G1VAT5_9GAMM|nr:hypothetical protein CLH62_19305 [Marinobacter guineae]
MKVEAGRLASHQLRQNSALAGACRTGEQKRHVAEPTKVAQRFQRMMTHGIRKKRRLHFQRIGAKTIALLQPGKQAAAIKTVQAFLGHGSSLSAIPLSHATQNH